MKFGKILLILSMLSFSACATSSDKDMKSASAPKGTISLSFDDAPRKSSFFSGEQRSKRLIESLKKSKVERVAFYVNTSKMDKEGAERINFYAKNGHLIGNHTHTHPMLNNTDLYDYIRDIREAHEILEPLNGFEKLFRSPYLREGNTLEKRDRVREDLDRLGYRNGYVTVNNYDWAMEDLFQNAKKQGKKINFDALKRVYVDVLVDSIRFYDDMAKAVINRSPSHVLLLHENDLAAMFISDLVKALRKDGWEVVSPEESYSDEISLYKTSTLFVGNPGRIGEIAKDNGWKLSKLWHEACDEKYLENLFISEGVFTK